MRYGEIDVRDAEGTILAHSRALTDGRLGKGHLLTAADIARLQAAGITSVIALRLEAGDLREDEAARRLTSAIAPDHLRFTEATTGRVNIHAAAAGFFVADRDTVDRFNRIDPAITLACLADHVPVRTGEMVATIKIIPLAVSAEAVAAGKALLTERSAFMVKPFAARSVTLIATTLPSLKPSVIDKTRRVLEDRLALSGSHIATEIRTEHRADAVAMAIGEALQTARDAPPMIVIFGASAMADFDDVIPAAIRAAGGRVEQAGMPVDPGNLLVLGWIGDVPIIGAPGCARSPKENGFDWILNRILAGERPTANDITGMGVGGLLMEIPTRPQPRETTPEPAEIDIDIGIVILAAGRASRMGAGGPHKLLAEFDGMPLVRRVAQAAIAARPALIVTVTGHRAPEVENALTGLDLRTVRNPDFADGMAGSLVAGLSAESMRDHDGVMVLLADMPGVTTPDLQALMQAFRQAGGQAIVRAVSNGKRGNPVILPRATYGEVMKLTGDIGARHIVETSGLAVIDVEIGAGAHLDVDTPEAVVAAGGILKG